MNTNRNYNSRGRAGNRGRGNSNNNTAARSPNNNYRRSRSSSRGRQGFFNNNNSNNQPYRNRSRSLSNQRVDNLVSTFQDFFVKGQIPAAVINLKIPKIGTNATLVTVRTILSVSSSNRRNLDVTSIKSGLQYAGTYLTSLSGRMKTDFSIPVNDLSSSRVTFTDTAPDTSDGKTFVFNDTRSQTNRFARAALGLPPSQADGKKD